MAHDPRRARQCQKGVEPGAEEDWRVHEEEGGPASRADGGEAGCRGRNHKAGGQGEGAHRGARHHARHDRQPCAR